MTAPSADQRFSATLPGHYYYDPAIFAREQERLFGRLWTAIGRAEELPATGDYRLAEVAGESIIVVRGGDGQLRAFYNVCRHRGARLCEAAAGHVAGALQCRYHAWTYGLDGQLVGAPNVLHAADFDRTTYGLQPVALAVWHGLIWLNLAERPGAIDEQLLPPVRERFGDPAHFERYGLAALCTARTIDYEVQANWKVIVENFTECYHCAPVHPEFVRLLPGFRVAQSYSGPGYAGTPLADDVEAFTIDGRGGWPRLPGLGPADDRLYYGFVLPPNVLVNLLADHAIVHIAHPLGPERTRVSCAWLFAAETVASPGFDPTPAVELFDLVNRQDWSVCELAQRGVRSRAYRRGGVYVPSEYELRQFNDFVQQHLEAPD